MKSLPRWLALICIVMLSAVAVGGVATAIYAGWLFNHMPDASDIADYRPPTATRVYAWDGTLIGEYSTERRIPCGRRSSPPRITTSSTIPASTWPASAGP